MIKNKNNITNPSYDGEFLDSDTTESNINTINTNTNTDTNTNSENKQEEVIDENVIPLDNKTDSPNKTTTIEIPLTISTNTNTNISTSSKNTTSTRKYKVILTSDTKYILDLEERGGGGPYQHTTYTKSLNLKSGDFVEEPKQEGN